MTSVLSHSLKYASLYSKKAFGIFTLTLLLFTSFLLLNQNAEAQQLVCPMLGIQQITDETSGDSEDSSINADGTRIAFRSDADINDGNPDGNFEIFIFDMTSGIFTQITDETTGDSRTTSIDADGTRIAFRSDADINGGNPDGNQEIYLAICFDLDDRVIPTLSQWGLIAMAGILGIVGFMVMRRRKVAA
ncbi:MAG: IPTL-CTERM sorting domain-containing protein [Candidatus Dadabacteria bacterium]|nr:IPTL-CTERM sorting domain-containing protein [Candidatus Dadabacteria bacterium]